MKKRFLLLLFSFKILCGGVNAQDSMEGKMYTPTPDIDLVFKKTSLIIYSPKLETGFFSAGEYEYSLLQEYSVPFLKLKGEKYLVLFDDNVLLMYGGEGQATAFNDGFWGRFATVLNPEMYNVSSSSHFVQGNESYPASNLFSATLNRPWVEGAPGVGIGESIEIKPKNVSNNRPQMAGFYFSNGYVSYNKPYLYQYNCRVKELAISELDGSKPIRIKVADSPNPQLVLFPEKYTSIQVKIVSVYQGTRWDDTCINFMIPIE